MAPKDTDSTMLAGGNVRDLAHIWQPKKGEEGSWLIGILSTAEEKTLDTEKKPCMVGEFTRAAVKVGRADWQSHRAVTCVLNKSILLRVSLPGDIGKVFAIRFDGFEESKKAGNQPWRSYTVVEQTSEKLAEVLRMAGDESALPF